MLTWKTHMWEKPRQPTDCENHYVRITKMGSSEATTYYTPSSPHGGYNRGNDLFLSLCLSLCTQLLTFYIIQQTTMFNNIIIGCPKSYLYSYDFRAIQRYSPRGSLEHIHGRAPSGQSGTVTTGTSNIRFFTRPIRRDLFPNNMCPCHVIKEYITRFVSCSHVEQSVSFGSGRFSCAPLKLHQP